MRANERKTAHQFNLFAEISSSEDDEADLEKERRGMEPHEILKKCPKYADLFLDKCKPLLQDTRVSKTAAGGAFTMYEKPRVAEWLSENPKSIQKCLRKLRTTVKQMNWAMTALLKDKDSPWRGLEVKSSLAEHGIMKLLELIRSGIAFGKFTETHEEDLLKLLDNIHKLYMDLFERRGQELLRGAIAAEIDVVYKLADSEGRLPDGAQVHLQDLASRADLNGKAGKIVGWDYILLRYNVELVIEDKKLNTAIQNPDMLGMEDDVDADEEDDDQQPALEIPKKIMVLRKNVQVDLEPSAKSLNQLVKEWNQWRKRARSVSITQDAEAVAAALGPPLESMANFMQEAAAAVATASACGKDGADLIAEDTRDALQNARNLAAKLLGEEPKEPPPPPPLNAPAAPLVAITPLDPAAQMLKDAAEVAAAGIEIKQAPVKKRSRSRKKRSRSRKRRKRSSSSSQRQQRPPKFT